MTHLRLGTRGSPLALYQAHAVKHLLEASTTIACEVVVIRTSGDRLADASLSEAGGKRLFVKEIEDALLERQIDLAVHSSKDMPVVLPDGLAIVATLPREDPRDAVVLPRGATPSGLGDLVRHLGASPRIGTSSIRRVSQLLQVMADATFLPIRGNLDTRLRKLDEGAYDAIVLAAAGLRRLGRQDRVSALIPVGTCVPAPGQGIIAVEVRVDDTTVRDALAAIDDPGAHAALDAERAVVRALGGGCQMPIGAFASLDGERMTLTAIVAAPDGSRFLRHTATSPIADAQQLGIDVGRRLLDDGAGEILAAVEQSARATGASLT
jgi:hydroxymethylbilane synthase